MIMRTRRRYYLILCMAVLATACNSSSAVHDLAIVKLDVDSLDDSTQSLLKALRPMRLADPGDWGIGDPAEIVGFGVTGPGGLNRPMKRVGSINIEECNNDETSGAICFEFDGLGHANCAGDSGGPMIRQANGHNVLVGVASSAEANCEAGEAIYVDITTEDHRAWLQSNITAYSPFAFQIVEFSRHCQLANPGDFRNHEFPVDTEIEHVTATVNFPHESLSLGGVVIYNNTELNLQDSNATAAISSSCDNSNREIGVCKEDNPASADWTAAITANSGSNFYQLTVTQLVEDGATAMPLLGLEGCP